MPENRFDSGISRRNFLQSTAGAGAGLILGLHLPIRSVHAASAEATTDLFSPNAFIRITPDDLVTVIVKHIEFGQGPLTGLATLVAEELDADWAQVRGELAPADVKLYAHTFGPVQFTGGSTAIANSFMQMRKAGATARAMLVEAAAAEWGVAAASIGVERGRVHELT